MEKEDGEYKLKGKEIIDKIVDIINNSNLKERNKDIYIRYYNLVVHNKKETLETIAIDYNITRERIRQLLKRTKRMLKKYNYQIIPLFNEIIGEKQYSYLIDGIIKQSSYKTLEGILNIVLNNNEFEFIKEKIDICMELSDFNDNEEKNNDSNRWKKWKLIEEQLLMEEFIMGKSIKEISEKHNRTKNAIIKRLIKLKLIKPSDITRFYN